MRGQRAQAKFKGMITITGVAAFFNVVGVFDLHAQGTSECHKSLSESSLSFEFCWLHVAHAWKLLKATF